MNIICIKSIWLDALSGDEKKRQRWHSSPGQWFNILDFYRGCISNDDVQ